MATGEPKKTRILIASLLIMSTFLFAPISAKAWGDAIPAALLKESLERAYKAFEDAMVANLKIAASNLIKGRLETLLTGGSSGSSLIITDYADFIYGSSSKKGQTISDDLFKSLKSNVSSSTKGMMDGVEAALKAELFGINAPTKSTMDNYVSGGLGSVFDQTKGGGQEAFLAAISPSNYNDPYSVFLKTYQSTNNEIITQQESKKAQAVAGQGYASKVNSSTNLINLPGSLIAQLSASAEELQMKIVAYARSIPEVIGTMAAQTLTSTIQTGINSITEPIDNQLREIHNTVEGGTSEIQNNIYNGVNFVNGL